MTSSTSKAFDMGKMAIGGIEQVLDSVEFVKRAWGGLNLPSTLVPTVDIDELDKRIADLKAVEQWLNMNLSMLRGTIQGLEIQRGTLAAVKAFGASFGDLAQQGAAEPTPPEQPAAKSAGTAASPAPDLPAMLTGINPTAWWNLLQQNFNQVAQAALTGGGHRAKPGEVSGKRRLGRGGNSRLQPGDGKLSIGLPKWHQPHTG